MKFLPILLLLSLLGTNLWAQQVDAGNGHAIIMDKDGAIWTVGRNNFGQLGIGSHEKSPVPVKVPGLPKAMAFSRGYDHSMMVDEEGHIWTWGRNNYGQLGTPLLIDYDRPVKLKDSRKFTAVEGGHWHSLGLLESGKVSAWGHNYYGELGNKTREHSEYMVSVLKQDREALDDIVEIASVGAHSLALNEQGEVYSWGTNLSGELGHFKNKMQTYAERVEGLPKIVSIAAGWHHSLALDEAGRVFIWGAKQANRNARTRDEKRYSKITPLSMLPKIKKIACGSWHSLAIDESDQVWTWGRGDAGMLGNGKLGNSETPVLVPELEGVCNIGGGCFQSMAVNKDGEIFTFGDNPSGQQGQNHYGKLASPAKMNLVEGQKVTAVEPPVEVYDAECAEKVDSPKKRDWTGVLIALLAGSVLVNGFLFFRRSKR